MNISESCRQDIINLVEYYLSEAEQYNSVEQRIAEALLNEGVDEDLSKLWQSAFFVSTFQRK